RSLSTSEVARLASRLSSAGGVDCFCNDLAGDRWILLEVTAEVLVYKCFDLTLNVRVEFAFSLTLELGLRQLDADYRYQTFANVFGRKLLIIFLEEARRFSVVIDRSGQGRSKAGQVCAAIHGVDVVGERMDDFVVAVVVLDRQFNGQRVGVGSGAFEVNRLRVKHRLVLVQMFDELGDAALVIELVLLFAAFVGNRDSNARV